MHTRRSLIAGALAAGATLPGRATAEDDKYPYLKLIELPSRQVLAPYAVEATIWLFDARYVSDMRFELVAARDGKLLPRHSVFTKYDPPTPPPRKSDFSRPLRINEVFRGALFFVLHAVAFSAAIGAFRECVRRVAGVGHS